MSFLQYKTTLPSMMLMPFVLVFLFGFAFITHDFGPLMNEQMINVFTTCLFVCIAGAGRQGFAYSTSSSIGQQSQSSNNQIFQQRTPVMTTGSTLGILKYPSQRADQLIESMTFSDRGSQESESGDPDQENNNNKTLLESRLRMINMLKSKFGDEISKIPDFLEFEASVKAEYLAKKRAKKVHLVDSYTQTPFEMIESLILHPSRLQQPSQQQSQPQAHPKEPSPLSLSPKSLTRRSLQQPVQQPARVWDSHPRQAWMVSSTQQSSNIATQQQPIRRQQSDIMSPSSYLQRFPVRTYTEREADIIHGAGDDISMIPGIMTAISQDIHNNNGDQQQQPRQESPPPLLRLRKSCMNQSSAQATHPSSSLLQQHMFQEQPQSIQQQLQHPQRSVMSMPVAFGQHIPVTSTPSLGSSSIVSTSSRSRGYFYGSEEDITTDMVYDTSDVGHFKEDLKSKGLLDNQEDLGQETSLSRHHSRHHERTGSEGHPDRLRSTNRSVERTRSSERTRSHASLVVEESASSDPDDSSPSSSSAAGNVVYKNIIITLRSDGSSDQEASTLTPQIQPPCPVHHPSVMQHRQ